MSIDLNPTHGSAALPTQESALDQALGRLLAVPALPDGFRNRLLGVVLQESLHSIEARRQALAREHTQSLQRLRSGHVHLQRDTLALLLMSAFAAGTVVHRALPWLQQTLGIGSGVALPLLALVIGMAAGVSVWIERFGWPRMSIAGD